MGIAELTQTRTWKLFMAKLYGFGAAVVIIGALFKIMHWPGAGPMLILGLGTEAIIFFFSAFEPLHEEEDWSLVYPQLAGLGEGDEIPVETTKAVTSSGESIAELDKMLEKSGGAELFERLGEGLSNLSETTSKLTDISDAAVATNEYATSVKAASESMNSLSSTNNEIASSIKESATSLSGSYSKNAQLVAQSGDDLASAYQSLIDSMSVDFTAVTKHNNQYGVELENINKNLSALNAVYELQLQSANDSLQKSQEFYGNLDNMMGDMQSATTEAENYRTQVTQLNKKLSALNTVYGNMLSAMNVKDV